VFTVLGEVGVDGTALTRRRERDLLALLVTCHGRPVGVDRIAEELWTSDVPRGAVQVVVSRLRTLLDPKRSRPPAVETTTAGYRLAAGPDDVDAWRFESLAERSLVAPTPGERVALATRALELWSGPPYAGSTAPSVTAEATRLEDLFVTVEECRAEALLELGHPAAAARLLTALAPGQPYREQLWALLARAQYACARQADALATLATLRTRLAEDLGVDPSGVVRSMEQAILTQDSGLDASRSPYVVGHTPVAVRRAAGTMTR
jgi:DNA-binding SARP family transcriptional activator